MTARKRLLFVHNVRTTFIDIDLALLRERYDVEARYLTQRHPRLFSQMWQAIQDVDAVIAWFASWHSLPAFTAAWLRRIPRLLITGGYDVANEPSIDYGLRRGGLPYLTSEGVFRLTTLALPFSQTATRETLQNTPLSAERTRALPLGVPDAPIFAVPRAKERLALTIATLDAKSIPRKGVDVFVAAAQHLPDVPFVVVGKARDDSVAVLQASAPENVTFTGYLSDNDLRELQRRAAVYVQASVHEGFGLAVAESMLARCMPVISEVGSLPEVVDDTGIYTRRDPQAIAQAIQTALSATDDQRERCRQRILHTYPLDQRAQHLYQHIDDLLAMRR